MSMFRSGRPFGGGLAVGTALCGILAASAAAQAQDGDAGSFRFSQGFDYSSGDYGASQDTDIYYVPFTGRYEYGPWTLRVTVPYIRIKGPGTVVGGGDTPIVIGDGDATRETEDGLGDVIAGVSYLFFPPAQALPFFELTGKIKAPTASENKRLGTGEVDYTIQADVFQNYGPFSPFGTIGYRFRGDPEGVSLDNAFFASGGGTIKFTDSFSGGAVLDYSEASSDAADDAFEVTPFVIFRLNDVVSLNIYGVIGFTDGSPDHGAGLQLSLRP